MQQKPRNVSLLQLTYDQANQQWVLHIGDSNSVSVVRDHGNPVEAEDTLRISDFGDSSSAVLELSFPCGEVIRQEFAPRDVVFAD